jgi:hypothetical protein
MSILSRLKGLLGAGSSDTPRGNGKSPAIPAERIAQAVRASASPGPAPVAVAAPRPSARTLQLDLHLHPAERMIKWLAGQPAEIVDAAAQALNWDQAEDVIVWILRQPATDAATAVKLFLRAEPAFYAGENASEPEEPVAAIIEAFAKNWTASRYARGGVGYDPSEVSEYGSSDSFFINEIEDLETQHRASGKIPWPPLRGLKGPFSGPRPRDIADYFKHDKDELFRVRFLLEELGSLIVSDDIDDDDYSAWRNAHGAGEENRPVYDMLKDDLPNIKRKLSE